MPQKNASHNPVTHPHLQLGTFPLCRSDSPGTIKSTGISVTWAPLLLSFRVQQVTLSFFSTAFVHPLFAQGTHCASKTMKTAVCFLMATQPGPKSSVGNNKVTPCSSLAGPGHSPELLLCSAWSLCFWSQDFSVLGLNLLATAQQSRCKEELGATSPKGWSQQGHKNTLPASVRGLQRQRFQALAQDAAVLRCPGTG